MSRTAKVVIALVGLGIVLGGAYYWRFVREIAVRTAPGGAER